MHIHAIISALLCHFYNHRHHDRKFFSIVLNCQMHKSFFCHSISIHHAKYYQICGNCIQSVNQLNRQKFIIMNSTRRWMDGCNSGIVKNFIWLCLSSSLSYNCSPLFLYNEKKRKFLKFVSHSSKKCLCIVFEVITAD